MNKVLLISLGVLILIIMCFSVSYGSEPATTQSRFIIAEGGHVQSSLDPLSRADISDISVNVFDSLICYDKKHNLISNVCSDWQVLDDGKTIEFTLKKGIKFSSGDSLTSADVEWSFNRLLEKIPFVSSQLASFDHIQVVDDYTIRFIFNEPRAIWPAESLQCLFICSKSYHDRVGEDEYNNNPVGTGPYKYGDCKIGEYTELNINENYYGTEPQIKRARFDIVRDQTTLIAMLKSGEADMITDVPYQMVANLEDEGYTITTYQMPHQVRLQFVLTNPNAPWANLKVRQAINYAIDKDDIIHKIFNSVPNPADSWLEPWEVGYDPSLKPNYPYDIAKAKQLMIEAGYPDGFEMPLYYVTNVTGAKDVSDYLANALKKLNISVKISGGPMNPSFMEMWGKWHSDPTSMAVFLSDGGLMGNPDPLAALNMAYISTSMFALYANANLDAVILELSNTSDPDDRAALIKKAIKIIHDDMPDVPIFNVVTVDAMKSNVTFDPHLYSGMGTVNVKDIAVK